MNIVTPPFRTARECIEHMADSFPDAVCLANPDGDEFTFGELQTQCRDIASHLSGLGCEPGDVVALAMENSLTAIRWLLGSMYAGMIATALNLNGGPRHIGHVLRHCCPSALVLSAKQRESLAPLLDGMPTKPLQLSSSLDALPHAASRPLAAVEAEQPALLIYTSGTTGEPKGVLHSHLGLAHSAWNMVVSHRLEAGDRGYLVVPLCHANSITVTILPSLFAGGSFLVPPRFDPRRFEHDMRDFGCTWATLVPTFVNEILANPERPDDASKFRGMRFMRTSSGPLAPGRHHEFHRRFRLPLLQGMGCSEAGNIFINPQPPAPNKVSTVGLPYGFELKTIDAAGRSLGVGQEGAVCVRGPSLMLGYFRAPKATSEAIDGDGWLHFGDLGRIDADGYLTITGRLKEIIIKGGVNIAAREIDEALEEHPAVKEAAAVGIEDPLLGEEIEAHVVLWPGHPCDSAELLDHCEQRIGVFKTPSRIFFYESLPKGPTGKVKRSQIERAKGSMGSLQIDSAEELAAMIAQLWSEFLHVDSLGLDHDFFAHGGTSHLAIKCVARLRRTTGLLIQLSDLYEKPTAAGLAQLLRRRTQGEEAAPAPSRPQPSRDPSPQPKSPPNGYVLTSGQQSLLVAEEFSFGDPIYNECECVAVEGSLDEGLLRQAVCQIAERHDLLARVIDWGDGAPVAAPRAEIAPAWIRLEDTSSAALRAAARQKFDLSREPGLRVGYARRGGETVILLMMHHVVSDRASFGIFWRELIEGYEALAAGRQPRLANLDWQFQQYADWKDARDRSPQAKKHLDYWLKALADWKGPMAWPGGPPAAGPFSGKKILSMIPFAMAQGLRSRSRQRNASLYVYIATALARWLRTLTGQDEFLIGVPVSDRELPQLQPIIGYMIGVYPLRLKIERGQPFGETLGQVREGLRQLMIHRHVPLAEISGALRRAGGRELSLQVVLNWRDYSDQIASMKWGNRTLRPIPVDTASAKFDLSLALADHGENGPLEVEWGIDTRKIDESALRSWIGQFEEALVEEG